MKAILFHEHGSTEVLKYADFPTPSLKPGEVLVKLHAAALNRMDLWVRNGWQGLKLDYPHILGADGAGQIAALGENVAGWQIGERVVINSNLGCGQCHACKTGYDNRCNHWHLLGETVRGTYAEYINVPAGQLFKLPEGFSAHAAAAAALVYHTAWHSLITVGKLKSDEVVLVVGASGGVNTASIQIAKYRGAKIIVVGSNPNKLELAESLGADLLIDRSKEENWAKSVYLHTNKQGVDVVVDNVGTTFPSSFRALRKGGRLLTVGNTGGAQFEIDNRFIFGKHLSVLGSTMGTQADFEQVMSLVTTGALQVVLDQTYPLRDAAAAHQRLESGQQLGKITLEIP